MKTWIGIALAAVVGSTVSAQQVPEPSIGLAERAAVEHQMLEKIEQARGAMESKVTKNAPYAAEAVTEFQQVLADGNRITRRTVAKVFRDREGRTRRETTVTIDGREIVTITLVDPVEGVSWTLDPNARTAFKSRVFMYDSRVFQPSGVAGGTVSHVEVGERGAPGGTVSHVEPGGTVSHVESNTERAERRRPEPQQRKAIEEGLKGDTYFLQSHSNMTREDLGQKTIEGVQARGTKVTTVIPAGSIGNEQAITVTSEQWFSPDLQTLVLTRHNDPRAGETTYRLTNIVQAEPDRGLFEVPSDYTVRELKERRIAPRVE